MNRMDCMVLCRIFHTMFQGAVGSGVILTDVLRKRIPRSKEFGNQRVKGK